MRLSSKRRRNVLLACVLAITLTAAACAGDDDSDIAPSDGDTTAEDTATNDKGISAEDSAASHEGSTSEVASDETGTTTLWTIEDPTVNELQQAAIDAFNRTGQGTVEIKTVSGDGYRGKLRLAMDLDDRPGLFLSWGGAPMREFADAGKIVDVESLPGGDEIREHFLPAVLAAGEQDGRLYGVPARDAGPNVIFYNKQVFADAGVEPPATWEELDNLVTVFSDRGITPFALAGLEPWTELMWVEYLVDRIGGPEVFRAIAAGEEGAWEHPAMLEAAQMITSLVDAGAFGDAVPELFYGVYGSSWLLATGEAAMQLMGAGEYGTQARIDETFADEGLGYVPFPTIPGGAGDPANVVGFWDSISVTTDAPAATAAGYLETLYSDDYVQSLVEFGGVPVAANAEGFLGSAPNPDYAEFQFNLLKNAPSFTPSWGEELGLQIATPMLTEIQNLFNGTSTPEQYVAALTAIS